MEKSSCKERSEQYICRITALRLKNSEQTFPVEGKAGNHNRRRGVYPRLHEELSPAEEGSPPHSPLQNHRLCREVCGGKAWREIVGSIRLHTTKSLKADASSIICSYEGLNKQTLRTFCPGNVFEDCTETLKTLFVIRISQKTKWNFTLRITPIRLLQSTEEGGRGTEGKESSLRNHGLNARFWICPGGGEQPPHLPQITPKPTAPFPQRGI